MPLLQFYPGFPGHGFRRLESSAATEHNIFLAHILIIDILDDISGMKRSTKAKSIFSRFSEHGTMAGISGAC